MRRVRSRMGVRHGNECHFSASEAKALGALYIGLLLLLLLLLKVQFGKHMRASLEWQSSRSRKCCYALNRPLKTGQEAQLLQRGRAHCVSLKMLLSLKVSQAYSNL